MFNVWSTIVVVVGLPTLGDDVLHFGQILLDFRDGDAEERLA